VESVTVAGNTSATDLPCVLPPPIPAAAHWMTQLVELPPADEGLRSHRHCGPVFGYVLQDRILFEVEAEVSTETAAGEAFREPVSDVADYQMGNLEASRGYSRHPSARGLVQ
jgi:hypothetical protein